MTDPTPLPPRTRMSEETARDLDQMARDAKHILETTAWDRRGPPQKSALPHEARGVIDPHPPTNIVRGGTVGTGYDHLEDLGRMSAEAVMKQCEATIELVKEMGATVHALVKRLGEALIEVTPTSSTSRRQRTPSARRPDTPRP